MSRGAGEPGANGSSLISRKRGAAISRTASEICSCTAVITVAPVAERQRKSGARGERDEEQEDPGERGFVPAGGDADPASHRRPFPAPPVDGASLEDVVARRELRPSRRTERPRRREFRLEGREPPGNPDAARVGEVDDREVDLNLAAVPGADDAFDREGRRRRNRLRLRGVVPEERADEPEPEPPPRVEKGRADDPLLCRQAIGEAERPTRAPVRRDDDDAPVGGQPHVPARLAEDGVHRIVGQARGRVVEADPAAGVDADGAADGGCPDRAVRGSREVPDGFAAEEGGREPDEPGRSGHGVEPVDRAARREEDAAGGVARDRVDRRRPERRGQGPHEGASADGEETARRREPRLAVREGQPRHRQAVGYLEGAERAPLPLAPDEAMAPRRVEPAAARDRQVPEAIGTRKALRGTEDLEAPVPEARELSAGGRDPDRAVGRFRDPHRKKLAKARFRSDDREPRRREPEQA